MEGRQEAGVRLPPRRTAGRGPQGPVRCAKGAKMCTCWFPRPVAGGEAPGGLQGVRNLLLECEIEYAWDGGATPSLANGRQLGPSQLQLQGDSGCVECKIPAWLCSGCVDALG